MRPVLVHEQLVHQDEPRCEVGLRFAGMEPHVVSVVVNEGGEIPVLPRK